MLSSTVGSFARFLEEAERGDFCQAYVEHYLEPNREIMDSYLRTHVPGGRDKLEERLRRIGLERYRAAYQKVIDRGLEAKLEGYWRMAQAWLPRPTALVPRCYLIFGLRTMDGCATNSAHGPAVAIGLETICDYPEERAEELLVHEYAHLAYAGQPRVYQYKCETPSEGAGPGADDAMTIGDGAVDEGLATLAPLVVKELPLTEENLRRVLWYTPEQFQRAVDLEGELTQALLRARKLSLHQHGGPFFFGTGEPIRENGWPDRCGYYVGARLILRILGFRGRGFYSELMTMPPSEVLALYENLGGHRGREYRGHCRGDLA
ncbi:MAG: hypothetical protein AB1331_02495 [Bacillota bacterium]